MTGGCLVDGALDGCGAAVATLGDYPPDALAAALTARGARLARDVAGADLVVGDLRGAVPAPAGDDWPEFVARTAAGAFALAREYRAARRAPAGGALLFLLHHEDADPERTAASALLAAVTSLVRTLSREWAPERIRLNCLTVGHPVVDDALADTAAYLAGPAGALITGQRLDLRA